MMRLLSREHDVTSFTDPREAVARLLHGPAFDVVFCDQAGRGAHPQRPVARHHRWHGARDEEEDAGIPRARRRPRLAREAGLKPVLTPG